MFSSALLSAICNKFKVEKINQSEQGNYDLCLLLGDQHIATIVPVGGNHFHVLSFSENVIASGEKSESELLDMI